MGMTVAVAAAFIAVLSGIGAKPPEEATAAAEPPTLTMQVTKTYMDGRVVEEPPVTYRLLD